jgi:hypothetical protein
MINSVGFDGEFLGEHLQTHFGEIFPRDLRSDDDQFSEQNSESVLGKK